MCGLYSLTTSQEAVRRLFPVDWQWSVPDAEFEPAPKMGPSAKKPGSTSNHRLVARRKGDEIEFASLRWRYEAKWMRDKGIKVPINARSETMWTNGLFKFSARDRRCLVIVDGFYEPKGPKGGKREQYLFTFPGQRPFALGGLWTSYKGDDDAFDGFIICTTEPNDQVSPIHNRMPVILEHDNEWTDWLTGSEDDARHLCDPIERPELTCHRVS